MSYGHNATGKHMHLTSLWPKVWLCSGPQTLFAQRNLHQKRVVIGNVTTLPVQCSRTQTLTVYDNGARLVEIWT
jgi:hypothetical protein